MRRFEIDQDALREAMDFLELRQPVYIKFSGVRGSGAGTYWLERGWMANKTEVRFLEKWAEETGHPGSVGTFHKIVLKSYLRPAFASVTLWHELAHAMQAERCTDEPNNSLNALKSWRQANDQDRVYKYNERPWEIEANSYEQFAAELPLCVPVDIR